LNSGVDKRSLLGHALTGWSRGGHGVLTATDPISLGVRGPPHPRNDDVQENLKAKGGLLECPQFWGHPEAFAPDHLLANPGSPNQIPHSDDVIPIELVREQRLSYALEARETLAVKRESS
jgi:hypothetical protein